MDYEWDELKRISNVEKHEIDFGSIYSFDWISAEFYPSHRYGEIRTIAVGYLGDRLHCVVFTDRGEQRRIISIRKANPPGNEKICQISSLTTLVQAPPKLS